MWDLQKARFKNKITGANLKGVENSDIIIDKETVGIQNQELRAKGLNRVPQGSINWTSVEYNLYVPLV